MAYELDSAKMQGLLVSAFGPLPCASYRLLNVDDPVRARASMTTLLPLVTTARAKNDRFSINVAFAASGLARLGVSDEELGNLSGAFLEGMASDRRARVNGD